MFETLFKQPAVLARYRESPLAEARQRFVEDCAKQGYARSTLRKIAWVLLAVAPCIDIAHGKVSAQVIEDAVDRRIRFRRQSARTKDTAGSRQMFVHFVRPWLRSLVCLDQPVDRPTPFATQRDAFVRYMCDERGLSPVTIATRSDRLAWFFDELRPSRPSLHAISIADIDAFIEKKHGQGWARGSLAALTSDLRSFFRYAQAQGWCAPSIAAGIGSPRLYAREGVPEGPSWEDVQRLLAATRGDDPGQIRDYAILMLLALYGLRRGEVARLSLDDLDWTGESICVSRPKQRRTQRYPLLPVVGAALVRYLREVRPGCAHRALFLTLSAPFRPLSAPSITALAHAHLTALGGTVPPHGAHCLRHACASHLLASGFSLKQIGDHLGHRSTNSTLAYTKVDLTGLRQVAELDLGGLL